MFAALLLALTGVRAVDGRRPTPGADCARSLRDEPDPAYRYNFSVNTSKEATPHGIALLEMTSQTWLSTSEVNKPEWTHWVTVIRPTTVKHRTALVFVAGGANDGKPPARPYPLLVDFALATQSVVAELRMVPNQPLRSPARRGRGRRTT